MIRVLVVWEDGRHATLGPFVKKRVTTRAPKGHTEFPHLLFHTTYGNGAFKRYVSSTWDNARAKGLPLSAGPIDHLICVPDGDKLHEQLDTIARPPDSLDEVPGWLAAAEQAWQAHLRGLCDKAPPATVHGRILRWSKESVVLAGYDRKAMKEHLGVDIESPAVREYLARCAPSPASVEDARFSNTFRRPLRCLTQLDEAQKAPLRGALVKNAVEIDDALRTLAREDCATIAERVPDIDRLADLIWQLAMPAPVAAAAAPAAALPAAKRPPRRGTRK